MDLYIQEEKDNIEIYSVDNNKCVGYVQYNELQSLGSIYIAKVEKVVKALNAAFVILEGERRAYLPANECVDYLGVSKDKKEYASISSFVHEGEWVLVQVIKDATGEKLPKVTQNIEWRGKNLLYKPFEFMCAVSKKLSITKKREILEAFSTYEIEHDGVLFRSSCEDVSIEELKNELHELRAKAKYYIDELAFSKVARLVFKERDAATFIWQQFSTIKVDKIYIQTGTLYRKLKELYGEDKLVFSLQSVEVPEVILQQVKQALTKEVFLTNGGSIVIEETEAFTVIDVNSKKSIHKRQYEATVKETNKIAAKEIAHQIMLRNIGGSILIDFISMKNKEHQKEVRNTLIEALKNDAVPHRILQFTELGILEMTRQRKEKSLKEQLTHTCEVCRGEGVIENK